ncbi:MAG TPA: cytochrome P450 [Thermoanaerobaculia bacterium]|jgi:cytochrome P450
MQSIRGIADVAERGPAVEFRRDPLRFLDQAFPDAGDAVWLPGRQLCVGEPAAARAVLANGEDLYEDHSDFFHTQRGTFGPRSAQEQIGRSSRAFLRAHLAAHADELADAVGRALVPASEWPDAGNRLVYRHLAAALLAPDSPARLRRTVDEVVERAVLAGARERYSRLRRAAFRFRVARELARAIEQRRTRGAGQPADVLDIVVGAAVPGTPAAELAEVFLSFVFAAAGSVGFVLGWSLYLLGTNPPTDAEPAWVVREALRLWPVAWLLGSRPARRHEVAGVEVTPRDEVVVCPYLVHRHPRYWDDPASFRPERWATVDSHRAYIPFGWGPHRCPAASLSLQLVEDVLKVMLDGYRLTFRPLDTLPFVGPALAPPRFWLGLTPRRP